LKEDSCLGFFNEQNEWECVDDCVYKENDQICGDTDHFTSFAILLNANDPDKCGDSSLVIPYLSLAVVSVCAIIVCAAWILIEIKVRYKAWERRREFSMIVRELSGKQQL
jgi:hypothetical protein